MNKHEVDPNKERKTLLDKRAGHMARADTGTEASRALRTRGSPKGGDTNKQSTCQIGTECIPKDSHAGDAEHRLQCSQITVFKEYTDGKPSDTKDKTGWLLSAQNRDKWKENEQEFGKTTAAGAA